MNAINFVVRTGTGAIERGVVGAKDQGYLIDAANGREISLNLHRSDLRGYDRAGNDLQITLADGRVIVLEDYFGADASSRLFLSTEGVLSEVAFAEGDGGALFAQYGDVAAWASRIAKGMDVLHESGVKGIPGTSMMAKGGCMNCSDEEIIAAVDYMVEGSQ